jgi:hypothetical protein
VIEDVDDSVRIGFVFEFEREELWHAIRTHNRKNVKTILIRRILNSNMPREQL